eukprot:gene1772-biopygen1233
MISNASTKMTYVLVEHRVRTLQEQCPNACREAPSIQRSNVQQAILLLRPRSFRGKLETVAPIELRVEVPSSRS